MWNGDKKLKLLIPKKEMINNLQKEKTSFKTGLLVLFLFVACMFPIETIAQDTLIKPKPVHLTDTLDFDKKTKGLFKKIIQGIKFKQNRDNNEKERVYQFMLELIKDNNLNIDSNIDKITEVIDSINRAESLVIGGINVKMDSINEKVKSNKETIDSLQISVIEAFKVRLDSIINEQAKNYFIEQHKQDSIYEESLKGLKSVQYSCRCLEQMPDDPAIEKDSICLRPRMKIIGWHGYSESTAFKNYNYNYLSAINLDSYELSIAGENKNPKKIEEFKKDGGVIDFAKKNCTDVYLTIHNKSKKEVTEFLKYKDSQNRLIDELVTLLDDEKINGVNIYFEVVSEGDNEAFRLFMKELHELKANYPQMVLNLTIPAIYNDESLNRVGAYNFVELNSMVDNYLVLTDKMTSLRNSLAQASSPLYSDDTAAYGTIQSTIDFYTNGKIPSSKLIMTVSYIGIAWPVWDFVKGNVIRSSNNYAYEIQYNLILEKFKNNKDRKNNIKNGFDPVQVAAYLDYTNTTDFFEPRYTKIWYENKESLKRKYKWVLDNRLAGVAIRDLGLDDGYTDLWNVLGTTLVKIDTLNTESQRVTAPCKYDTLSPYVNIFKGETWDNLYRNFQLYPADSSMVRYSRLTKKWVDSTDKRYFARVWSDFKWASASGEKTNYKTKYFKEDVSNESNALMNNKNTCDCLQRRFVIYARTSFYIGLFCVLIFILLGFRINYFNRYNIGSPLRRNINKKVGYLFIILAALFFLFWLYISPEFPAIGASNDGDSDYFVMIFPLAIGIIIGIFVLRSINKGKYIRKDLP